MSTWECVIRLNRMAFSTVSFSTTLISFWMGFKLPLQLFKLLLVLRAVYADSLLNPVQQIVKGFLLTTSRFWLFCRLSMEKLRGRSYTHLNVKCFCVFIFFRIRAFFCLFSGFKGIKGAHFRTSRRGPAAWRWSATLPRVLPSQWTKTCGKGCAAHWAKTCRKRRNVLLSCFGVAHPEKFVLSQLLTPVVFFAFVRLFFTYLFWAPQP